MLVKNINFKSISVVRNFRTTASDGNGRISRLLKLLLLYKDDYMVGKYISIEKIIEETKESYYDALKKVQLFGTIIKMITYILQNTILSTIRK